MTGDSTLQVTDERTGRRYEIPIRDGAIHAIDLRQIKMTDGDVGLLSYDPAFLNTASCRSAITFIDGERGILRYRGYPIEELAEHAQLPRRRLSADQRRAARQGRVPRSGPSRSPTTPSSTRTSRSSSTASTTTPIRWASWSAPSAALSTFYPDAKDIFDESRRRRADDPADRQDADPGGVRLPARDGPAVRLPGQRPVLHRQLPEHDVEDHRAGLPAEPGARARAGRAVHPARRPRAELLHATRCAPSAARTPTRIPRLRPPPRHCTARCTAGRTSRCCGCSPRSARSTTCPATSSGSKRGELRLMGFGHRVYKNYDPRAKIIKSDRRPGLRGHRRQPAARHRAGAGDGSRSRTTTSSSTSSTRTSTSTPASSTRRWASRSRCSRCCSRSAARAGWLAQWEEGILDREQKITRPRQLYSGAPERHLNVPRRIDSRRVSRIPSNASV